MYGHSLVRDISLLMINLTPLSIRPPYGNSPTTLENALRNQQDAVLTHLEFAEVTAVAMQSPLSELLPP